MAFQPCVVPAPSCEHTPHRQALLQPLGVMAPAMTRCPSLIAFARPSRASRSHPPVRDRSSGPWRPGYSPLRMCTSVPQIVVVVTRIRASNGPTSGTVLSSSTMRPGSTKMAAFIMGMGAPIDRLAGKSQPVGELSLRDRPYKKLAPPSVRCRTQSCPSANPLAPHCDPTPTADSALQTLQPAAPWRTSSPASRRSPGRAAAAPVPRFRHLRPPP